MMMMFWYVLAKGHSCLQLSKKGHTNTNLNPDRPCNTEPIIYLRHWQWGSQVDVRSLTGFVLIPSTSTEAGY